MVGLGSAGVDVRGERRQREGKAGGGSKLSALRASHTADAEKRQEAVAAARRQVRGRRAGEERREGAHLREKGVEGVTSNSVAGQGLKPTTAAAAPSASAPRPRVVLQEVAGAAAGSLDDELEQAAAAAAASKMRATGGKLTIGGIREVEEARQRRTVIALSEGGGEEQGFNGGSGRWGGRGQAPPKKPPVPKLNDWFRKILVMDFFEVVAGEADSTALRKVPESFPTAQEYVRVFQPLVLEEFKAQLQRAHEEGSMRGGGGGGAEGAGGGTGGRGAFGSDMTYVGELKLLSVERVDDFQVR